MTQHKDQTRLRHMLAHAQEAVSAPFPQPALHPRHAQASFAIDRFDQQAPAQSLIHSLILGRRLL